MSSALYVLYLDEMELKMVARIVLFLQKNKKSLLKLCICSIFVNCKKLFSEKDLLIDIGVDAQYISDWS